MVKTCAPTTYVLDFVNDPEEVLASFKAYYTTAELSATTDPNRVFNLRAKLDAAGHYDDFEVDRVVAVELNPNARQSELVSALEPVQDRIMKRYQFAQAALKVALDKQDDKAARAAQDELDALVLFKADMGAYQPRPWLHCPPSRSASATRVFKGHCCAQPAKPNCLNNTLAAKANACRRKPQIP